MVKEDIHIIFKLEKSQKVVLARSVYLLTYGRFKVCSNCLGDRIILHFYNLLHGVTILMSVLYPFTLLLIDCFV